jgi:hypothetical protein
MFPEKMNQSLKNGSSKQRKRPRVALIGCGASGMCFLHALATRNARKDDDAILPYVTCFEQASEEGGCWRHVPTAEEREQPHNVACWYDDVWSSVGKECFEFADYTYQEHFGKAVPTFLPKAELLDYFKKRTLNVDPDLLDGDKKHELHEIRYGTVVTSVSYDGETGLFSVATAPFDPLAEKKHKFDPTLVEEYDYCIWAAGIRGKPRIPRALLSLLKSGQSLVDKDVQDTPFQGTIMHSIHAASTKLEPAVAGKRVVLIGDSDSAVDLSLHAVKLGASKVIVLSRSGYGDCFYMGSWPRRKDRATRKTEPIVEVHVALPYRIVDEGKSIECAEVVWNPEEGIYEMNEEEETVIIENVDTIIFCTGFVPNTSFLSEDLQLHSEDLFSWVWSAPPDFKMRENPLTPDMGEVKPSAELSFSGNLFPAVYRSVLISNPKMMYIMDINSEYPLLHLEAEAWTCLAFCTGDLELPPKEVIDEEMKTQMLEEMNIAYLRWSVDRNYFEAMFDLGDEHWSDNYDDPRTIQINEEYLGYYIGLIARNLRDSKYPVDLGTFSNLSELGEKLVQLGMHNLMFRHLLDPESDESTWRTYRDANPQPLRSIYTGQESVALPKPWLELKDGKDALG